MIHLPVRLFHEVKMLVLQSGSVSDPSSRTVYFLDSCEMVLRDEQLIRSLVHSVPVCSGHKLGHARIRVERVESL